MRYSMLIVEDNSVYEIDEECIQKRKVPPECKTAEKLRKCQENQFKRKQGKRQT